MRTRHVLLFGAAAASGAAAIGAAAAALAIDAADTRRERTLNEAHARTDSTFRAVTKHVLGHPAFMRGLDALADDFAGAGVPRPALTLVRGGPAS